jgi:ankyrin repeat protein
VTTLDNLKKEAKRWLKALRAGDASARERLRRTYPNAPRVAGLRDVQHALAREGGHESWIALTRDVDARSGASSPLEALLRAAGRGDADAVGHLLDETPSLLDQRGSLGHSGLRTALHFGIHHEAVVRVLLEHGADPNVRDEGDHAYPIHFAAERGELPIVTLLVEHGADPQGAGTGHLLDAVGWAVCFDDATHVDVARYLLAHGATYTLMTAVALGEPDAIRDTVRAGENLDQRMDKTNRHRTATHLAIIKKQPASLATLIELGADLNAEDGLGLTPLDVAALNAEIDMANALIDAGARITLTAAIALGRREDAERIVKENPDCVSDRLWANILVQASARASGVVLDRLIHAVTRLRGGLTIVNLEADPEAAVDEARGYTALHQAAFYGNVDAVRVLLKHGANPRARDSKWRATPAGWAAYAGQKDAADLLLQGDVDIFDAIGTDRGDLVSNVLDRDPGALDRPFKAYATLPNEPGQWWPGPDATPLDWARSTGRASAERTLIARGAGTRTVAELRHAERVVSFLHSACWDHHVHGKGDHRMHDRAAQRILTQDSTIATDSLYTAIVCGEVDAVRRIVSERPETAREAGGARRWTPILYLAYTRFTHPNTTAHAVEIAQLLLDAGANPNDFYMAGDAKYSVLVGIAGEGEQDSPRQPYAAALFELLLERGAEPFDIQVLYNTHFSADVLWWLELVYAHTVETPRGAAWKDPEWTMLDMGGYGSGARFILWTALKARNLTLAEWALARGANPNAGPPRAKSLPQGSLYESALSAGYTDFADLLAKYGAVRTPPRLSGEDAFISSCLRLDRSSVEAAIAANPEYLRSPRAIFEAAECDRPDVIALLLDVGVAADIRDARNTSALHHAAGRNAVRAAAFLIDRGVEIDPRETNWGGTPMGWAAHGDRREMMDFLSGYTRAVWALCFNGYIDRLADVIHEDPSRAKGLDEEGNTLLWWLPDEEGKAMRAVELLLAAGVNPAQKNRNGNTAADWARRRGMTDVAARLGANESSG